MTKNPNQATKKKIHIQSKFTKLRAALEIRFAADKRFQMFNITKQCFFDTDRTLPDWTPRPFCKKKSNYYSMFCFYHFRQTNAPLGLGTCRALFTHCKWLLNLPKLNEKLGRWHTTSSNPKSKKQRTHSLQLRGCSTLLFRRHNSSPQHFLSESLFFYKNAFSVVLLQSIHWKKWTFKTNLKKTVPKIQSPKKNPKHYLFSSPFESTIIIIFSM